MKSRLLPIAARPFTVGARARNRAGKALGRLVQACAVAALVVGGARAGEVLRVHELTDDVYAMIGPLTNRNAENLGNNANFGVIVTDAGVVLVDPGGSYQGAKMIHAAVRTITDKPITVVINTGGQDHRWLGNGYFKAMGSRIIAHEAAVADQQTRSRGQLIALADLIGADGIEGTEPVHADETFSDSRTLTMGATRIDIGHAGHAHTPGDSYVWLPERKVLFSGDIIYVDRMLSIGPQSAHKGWISAFETVSELDPAVIVPGHGAPVDMAKARADSYDYLVFLRQAVMDFMEDGGGIEDVGAIDQSRFSYLANYDALKGRNAQRVYEELEWE
jgi:glyoxylase-like metal-dependent hydrolase (beta-lactamase superfamily II)